MGPIPLKGYIGLSLALIQLLLLPAVATSQENAQNQSRESEMSNDCWNLETKTFGGKQFWTDINYVGGWRIQENAVTGHYRLIDDQNVRHAWGTFDSCRRSLDQQIADGKVKPTSGKVVIVLHGLIRTTKSMDKLGKHLESNGDYKAIAFEYASTRKSVKCHAEALARLIDSLGSGVTEINFVAHSLGNIVVRRYLFDTTDAKTQRQGDPRIKRMVMIGPPNNGSQLAKFLSDSFVFNAIAGSSGTQMGENWKYLDKTLAVPQFEFGIIAGGQADGSKLTNILVSGPDDFTVGVEETKLDGASDFLVRPLLHSTMMKQPVTMKATLSFLRNGYFISEDQRQPIPSATK